MQITLEDCPFCSATARISYNKALSKYGRNGVMTTIICTDCRCRISRWGKTEREGLARASKAWNRRPQHNNIEV